LRNSQREWSGAIIMSLKPHPGPGLLRVQVDRERCQGHARCVAVASELFQLDAFGNAHEIGDGIVPPDLEVEVRLAASYCPELAIAIIEKQGG
jgi:ferredoxin